MTRNDRDELLRDLKQQKKNRSPSEAAHALQAWGFQERDTSKGHVLWQNGTVSVTLPFPHGRDRILLPRYVSYVVRAIEQVKGSLEDFDDDDE